MKYDIRRNVDGTWSLVEKTETFIIPNSAPYTYQLEEHPDGYPDNVIQAAPSINGYSITYVYPPSSGQFYVDFSSGTIAFNAANAGQTVTINYYGMGSPVRASDINNLESSIATIQENLDTMPYAKRVDFTSDTLLYKGEAEVGSVTSAAVWRIQKIVLGSDGDVTITWADGNSNFDNIWDNRVSLSYS